MNLIYDYLKNKYGEKIAADATDKFCVYRDFLIFKNSQFNLTAITEPDEIETKHFIDSLAAADYVCGEVADIGTGAGFPGIPIKIVNPSVKLTLIDSLNKRIGFLNELISKLEFTDVITVHSRAEDLPKNVKYDTVVSRAVADMRTLAEYTLPFVKCGGTLIAYKSNKCRDEIEAANNAIKVLGGELVQIKDVNLYGTDAVRSLVIIKKVKETPLIYPRSGNKPKKSPL